MRRDGVRRRLITVGVLPVLLVLAGVVVHRAKPAEAQIMGDLPTIMTYRLGPVSVGQGEVLRISYGNLFMDTPSSFSVSFLDANSGTLLGGIKDVVVTPGTGDFADFAGGTDVSVVAVVGLAEPRPDPVLTAQLLVGGSAAWLAEPRPDPVLKHLGF